MKATAGGTLIGPDADAIAIRNLSAFPIRVKQIGTIAEAPFNLVDDVDKSSGNNDFMMTVNGSAAKQSVELPDDGTWAMGYAGNEKGSDVLPLTISGAKIARVTADLEAAKKAATVTWTVEPTTTIKPEPKPDPENGVAFAVYSADDQSFNLYKRDRKPDVGDQFNGKTVTEIIDIDEKRGKYHKSPSNIESIIQVEVIDNGIKPEQSCSLFNCLPYVTTANVAKLDTSINIYMGGAFRLYNLTNVDLSSWDVSNVESMSNMFAACYSLVTVGDLSNWNTSNVNDFSSMFSGCRVLSNNLDCSTWNTSNANNMENMFNDCREITSFGDLSNWKTSNVNNMSGMFGDCFNLVTVGNLANWDVSNLYILGGADGMFSRCTKLTSVGDLSGWDVSHIESMGDMFCDCSSLTSLGDISGWDTSTVGQMSNMFSGCSNLSANCSNWNIQNVLEHDNFNSNAPGVIAPNWN